MNKTIAFLLAAASTLLISCSEETNSEKYRSEPPMLSDITVKPLNGNDGQIHAGQRFLATAEQSKLGRLLNATTYTWTSNSDNISHSYESSVVYDNDTRNPTDTLVANAEGTYTLTFTGKYKASGNTQVWAQQKGSTFSEDFASGDGKVTYYTGGIFYFTVTATKQVDVVP